MSQTPPKTPDRQEEESQNQTPSSEPNASSQRSDSSTLECDPDSVHLRLMLRGSRSGPCPEAPSYTDTNPGPNDSPTFLPLYDPTSPDYVPYPESPNGQRGSSAAPVQSESPIGPAGSVPGSLSPPERGTIDRRRVEPKTEEEEEEEAVERARVSVERQRDEEIAHYADLEDELAETTEDTVEAKSTADAEGESIKESQNEQKEPDSANSHDHAEEEKSTA